MDYLEAHCLGCRKKIKLPKALKPEMYDGKPVAFCSKSCNFKFINEEVEKQREQEMKDLIKRLEGDA